MPRPVRKWCLTGSTRSAAWQDRLVPVLQPSAVKCFHRSACNSSPRPECRSLNIVRGSSSNCPYPGESIMARLCCRQVCFRATSSDSERWDHSSDSSACLRAVQACRHSLSPRPGTQYPPQRVLELRPWGFLRQLNKNLSIPPPFQYPHMSLSLLLNFVGFCGPWLAWAGLQRL